MQEMVVRPRGLPKPLKVKDLTCPTPTSPDIDNIEEISGLSNRSRLEQAAKWLACNGPGREAVIEAKRLFLLTAKELAQTCAAASKMRAA